MVIHCCPVFPNPNPIRIIARTTTYAVDDGSHKTLRRCHNYKLKKIYGTRTHLLQLCTSPCVCVCWSRFAYKTCFPLRFPGWRTAFSGVLIQRATASIMICCPCARARVERSQCFGTFTQDKGAYTPFKTGCNARKVFAVDYDQSGGTRNMYASLKKVLSSISRRRVSKSSTQLKM